LNIIELGKRTVFVTAKKILEKCPTWELDQEPPFTIYKAVGLAQEWSKKRYPKFTTVQIVSISLSPI
jgi:hypothetical protein